MKPRNLITVISLIMCGMIFTSCVTDNPTYVTGEPRSRTLIGTPLRPAYTPQEEENAHPMPASVIFQGADRARGAFEPAHGIYLGAWLSPTIQISSFVAQTGHNHAAFVYEIHLCDPVPANWVLQCMAVMATPIFVVHPPRQHCNETPIGEIIAELAQGLGAFNIPMFVAFYPTTGYYGHGLAPAEYSIIFRYARSIFMRYAPRAKFVWVAPSLEATNRNPFYPGADAIDWVGVGLFAERDRYGFRNDAIEHFAPFYQTFAPIHPIMLLPVGVSHFSRSNHSYYIEEAAFEILRIYQALLGFPRVGLVAYGDAFGVVRTQQDDFSITVEKKLVTAYHIAAHNPYFITKLEAAESDAPLLVRSAYFGYVFDNNIYLDITTLAELDIPTPRQMVEINGSPFICTSQISDRHIWFCQIRQAIMVDVW